MLQVFAAPFGFTCPRALLLQVPIWRAALTAVARTTARRLAGGQRVARRRYQGHLGAGGLRDSTKLSGKVNLSCSFLVGEQIAEQPMGVYNVYPQGNFIQATEDTPLI